MLSLSVFTLATFFAALHGYRNSQQQVDALFDKDLVNMATFIANIQTDTLSKATDTWHSELAGPAQNLNRPLDNKYIINVDMMYQILSNGNVLQRSQIAPSTAMGINEAGFKDITFFGKRWRTYSLQISEQLFVVVAQPTDYRRDSTESILLTTVAPIIYAMPVIGILLFYVIRKSLGSLVSLSTELKGKSSDDLAQIDIGTPPKELQPVVTRLNLLLHKLSLAFDRERTLSANAAHELRTPVSVLRLTAHNLREAHDQKGITHSQFDELDANVNRMAHVIEQIIALYRYSPEHFTEQMREVSLDHLLREVIAENYSGIEQQNQEITLEAIPAVISGEPFALQILFENVLKNAIKYSGEGSHIVISMTAKNKQVEVCIEDSGHVDPDEIARLTDTFYRAKSVAQTGVKGSGLGLSIVQYIAHIHGAELSLSQSKLGGLAVSVHFNTLPMVNGKPNV